MNNNSSNAHRTHQANLSYCLILQNRLSMQYVPNQFIVYYINSKRRFFLYFKFEDHLKEVMNIFDRENVKYQRRNSLFPDREELQQILYHCNFKHKQKDLRRNLKLGTILNQPKCSLVFPTQTSQYREQNRYSFIQQQPKQKLLSQQFYNGAQAIFHHQGTEYLQQGQEKILFKDKMKSKSFYNQKESMLKKQEFYAKQKDKQMDIQKNYNQSDNQPQHQFVADFGHIKIKNPQVLKIINNKELLKRLFQAEKLR